MTVDATSDLDGEKDGNYFSGGKEIKENELALSRNERFLEETQRIARVGSWEADLTDDSMVWSALVKEIYEVQADFEPTFDKVMSFFTNEEDREYFRGLVVEAMEHGRIFDVELRIATLLGSIRWIRTTGKAEYRDGECFRIYGAVQDITDQKKAERALVEARNQFQSLIQTINGIVWEADAGTFSFFFVSDQVRSILGYTPEQWLSDPNFWANHIHASDREEAVMYCKIQISQYNNHTFDYRMIHADGSVVWIKDVVSVVRQGDRVILRGVMVDITESKRIEELERLEKSVLELNSNSDNILHQVLLGYLTGIEAIFPQMHCSIHEISAGQLDLAISPSLPRAYLEEILNLPIGPNSGSCGTAAFLKESVIAPDISTDPRWTELGYHHIALRYNLKSCWSLPVLDSDGGVMATFGFYYDVIKEPSETELRVITRSAAILKVIMESRQKSVLLKESASLMKQGQGLAHFGSWQWDLVNNKVDWSDELFNIYGQEKGKFTPSYERYIALLHPEDRDAVEKKISGIFQTKKDIVFEERIISPNLGIRHLKSWGRLQLDENGVPEKVIGACLDITESKVMQEQLLESQVRLKSLVDAQTNYVIRMDLEGNCTYFNNKYLEDFGANFENTELLGKRPGMVIVPSHVDCFVATCQRSIAHPDQVFQVEFDIVTSDGKIRSTFWHFIGLVDAQGKAFEIQCIGLDISEVKRVQNELRISDERYRYVNKATNDAIYDWTVSTDHVQWGEGFTRLFGFDVGERRYPAEEWFQLLHPTEREAVKMDLKAVINDRERNNWLAEYQLRKSNGRYAYVVENGYIIRDAAGKAVRMIGVIRDVSKQKKEEYFLKLQESAIAKANDLVTIAEVDMKSEWRLKIIYANEAFSRAMLYLDMEIMHRPILVLLGTKPSRSDVRKLLKAVENGVAFQIETTLYKKDGRPVRINFSLNPIANEKGIVTHWVCIGHDVTERYEYIAAIEDQNKKLSDIAWMQSHVARAPLARLMGLIDLLRNFSNTENESRELLDRMLHSARELDGVIRNISANTGTA